MKHLVHPASPARLAVGYVVPGTAVLSVAADFPNTARAAAEDLAERLTRDTAPPSPMPAPEERRLAPGFYDAEDAS